MSEVEKPRIKKLKSLSTDETENRLTPIEDKNCWTVPLVGNNGESQRFEDFQVFLRKDVYTRILDYACLKTDREVGGVILGKYYKHDANRKSFIDIVSFIEAENAEERATTFTFTIASMEQIYKVKDKEFPETPIIGWFHTHPGFGIFLSGMDIFIQKNYFPRPWQVAYVVDPIHHTLGFFRYKDKTIVPCQNVYLYDLRAGEQSVGIGPYQLAEIVHTEVEQLGEAFLVKLRDTLIEEFDKYGPDKETGLLSKAWNQRNFIGIILTICFLIGSFVVTSNLFKAVNQIRDENVKSVASLNDRLNVLEKKIDNGLSQQHQTSTDMQKLRSLTQDIWQQTKPTATPVPLPPVTVELDTVFPDVPEAEPEKKSLEIWPETLIIIEEGDNLWRLCRKYYGQVTSEMIEKLSRLNHLEDPNILIPGTYLAFPDCEYLMGM